MSERMQLHHTKLFFLLLLQTNIATVYVANMAAPFPQEETQKT